MSTNALKIVALSPRGPAPSPKATDVFVRPLTELLAGLGQFVDKLPTVLSVDQCTTLIAVLDHHAATVAAKFEAVRNVAVNIAASEVDKQVATVAKQKAAIDLMRRVTSETAAMAAALSETKTEPPTATTTRAPSKKWGDDSSDSEHVPTPKWNNKQRVTGILRATPGPSAPVVPATVAGPVAPPVPATVAPAITVTVVASDIYGVSAKVSFVGSDKKPIYVGGAQLIDNTGVEIVRDDNRLCRSTCNHVKCTGGCGLVGHSFTRPQTADVYSFMRYMSAFVECRSVHVRRGDDLRWAITAVMILDDYKVDLASPKLCKMFTAPLAGAEAATDADMLADLKLAANGHAPLAKAKAVVALLRCIAKYTSAAPVRPAAEPAGRSAGRARNTRSRGR